MVSANRRFLELPQTEPCLGEIDDLLIGPPGKCFKTSSKEHPAWQYNNSLPFFAARMERAGVLLLS
jgi:hypothetical protein